MLEPNQIIKRAIFENKDEGLIARFGPLINDSQMKHSYNDELFHSLKVMNELGWKLEGFAVIWDSNDIKMQIAIFTNQLNSL